MYHLTVLSVSHFRHFVVSVVLSHVMVCHLFFFFFQAEDGIRDLTVTGVQTCALPISADAATAAGDHRDLAVELHAREPYTRGDTIRVPVAPRSQPPR